MTNCGHPDAVRIGLEPKESESRGRGIAYETQSHQGLGVTVSHRKMSQSVVGGLVGSGNPSKTSHDDR